MRKINIILILSFTLGFATHKIALFPFYSPQESVSWLSVAIPEGIFLKLKSYNIEICDREIIYKKYQELISKVSAPNVEDIAKIAKEELADFAVYGIFTKRGKDSISIYVEIIDVFLAKDIYTKSFISNISNLKGIKDTIATFVILKLGFKPVFQEGKDYTYSIMPSIESAYEFLMKGFIFHIGYGESKNIDSALYFYQRSYNIDSTNFYLLYNLGNLYLDKLDYDKALVYYLKALSLGFTDLDLLNNISVIYLYTEQLDKAYTFLKKAHEIDRNNPAVLTNLGIYFFKKGDYQNAMEKFREVLNQQPHNYSALYYLSLCYIKISQFEKAKKILLSLLDKKIPRVSPYELYINLALVNQHLGQYLEAEIYYKKALKENPHPKTFLCLADLYLIMNEKTKAIRILEDALILYPNELTLYFKLGELNEILNNWENAIKYYLILLNLSPNNIKKGEITHRIAKLYYLLGLKNKAEEYFTKAYRYNPQNLSLLRDIALFYFKEGNFSKAKIFYEMVYKMGYQEVEVFKFLGVIYSYEKDYKSAIKYFKKATEVAPEIGDLWYYLGEQYTRIEEIDSAKKYFEKALNCNFLEEDVKYSLYYNLGIIYQYNQKKERFGPGFEIDKSIYYLKKAWIYEPYRESIKENIRYIESITGKKIELGEAETTTIIKKKKTLPNLVLFAEFNDKEGNGNFVLDAEETAKIIIEVQNLGEGHAGNVEIIATIVDTLKGLIMKQNRTTIALPAGEKKQIEFPIKGDFYLQNGVAKVLVEAKETYFGLDADPVYVVFETKAISPPQLVLLDYGIKEGVILPGKSAEIHITIGNVGEGKAQDVYVFPKLPKNVKFVTEDSVFYFPYINSQGKEKIIFEIVPSKNYNSESLSIVLHLKEKYEEFSKYEKISFPIKKITKIPREVIATPIIPEFVIPISDVDTAIPFSIEKNPKDFGIIIANKNYDNKAIPPVIFAEKDGEIFKKYLINIFGINEDKIIFKTNFTKSQMEKYFGTKEDYKGYIYNLVKDICDSSSKIFIYYSGHGVADPDTREPYLVPSDADPNFIRQNGYSLKLLIENLEKLPVKKIFLIIEACFSGVSDNGPIITGISPLIVGEIAPKKSQKVYCFTATTENQVAIWYREAGHGLFTYYLLKGLRGEADLNKDFLLTLGELKKYVTEKVILSAKNMRDLYQKPIFTGPEELILVRYKKQK